MNDHSFISIGLKDLQLFCHFEDLVTYNNSES